MKGFAALLSVIIIGSVLVAVGMMVTLTSINEGQMSLSGYLRSKSRALTDACIEEALLSVNSNNSLPGQVVTPLGVCPLVVNSQSADFWDFTVVSNSAGYRSGSRITLNRTTILSIISWQDQ